MPAEDIGSGLHGDSKQACRVEMAAGHSIRFAAKNTG